jgi:N-acetylglucosamine repressor
LEFISIGIATVVNLFNPSAVFVNGKLFTLQPDVLTRVGDRVRSHALRPSTADLVMMPASGNKMEGAMTGLLDRLFESVGPRLS